MREPLARKALRARLDTYLADHYNTLHVTIVSLTLGVAGVVASSLLAGPSSPIFDAYQGVFYILWGASLLCVAVAYGGPMMANILMPARIPAVIDFVLPVLIAACEFLLFAILGYRIAGWTSPREVFVAWWFTLAAFCFAAVLQTARAYYLIVKVNDPIDVGSTIDDYAVRLKANLKGAALVMSLSGGVGTYYVVSRTPGTAVSYALAGVAVLALLLALNGHRKTANELRVAFARLRQ